MISPKTLGDSECVWWRTQSLSNLSLHPVSLLTGKLTGNLANSKQTGTYRVSLLAMIQAHFQEKFPNQRNREYFLVSTEFVAIEQGRKAGQQTTIFSYSPIIYTTFQRIGLHPKMSQIVNLSDTPRMLNPRAWRKLRAFAPNDLLALIYINAPYPDETEPSHFFWDYPRSASEALSCYKIGRSLLRRCRECLNCGRFVATGRDVSGKRTVIPASQWVDLWPMFATNRAMGPNRVYEEVQISKATSLETPHARLSSKCAAWLKERKTAGIVGKKFALFEDAQQEFGAGLTHAIFNAGYLSVFGRKRGRPKSLVRSKH